MDTKSSAVLVNTSEEGMELKEGKDLLANCKRTKFSVSIVQPQQGVEISDTENKVPNVHFHKVSAGKDPMNRLTKSAVQSNGDANGCIKGHAHETFFTGVESAESRLPKICSANGWKEPSYDFEEQGPPHNKLFRCKVSVHMEGVVNTVFECFSDPKCEKKAAQEHAARGAMWLLAQYGYVRLLDVSTAPMWWHLIVTFSCQTNVGFWINTDAST
ncbi:hypothetical protein QOZ80_6AG0535210 [Eleusine coracana subsp. coracana]|nr:hypothetical protein QOZ80_6AG0535210 [Eleusine coracana subsp. coracana]